MSYSCRVLSCLGLTTGVSRGHGVCSQVAEAFDTVRQKKVAIKKIINVFDQEIDCKRLYREIYILRHLAYVLIALSSLSQECLSLSLT